MTDAATGELLGLDVLGARDSAGFLDWLTGLGGAVHRSGGGVRRRPKSPTVRGTITRGVFSCVPTLSLRA